MGLQHARYGGSLIHDRITGRIHHSGNLRRCLSVAFRLAGKASLSDRRNWLLRNGITVHRRSEAQRSLLGDVR